MALFGNLFKKKECAICGGEIGLLGNRKLADGNMCKNCAKKLSPWFDERKESTVKQIQAQLESRAKNAEELKNFKPIKQIGDSYHVMLVEEKDGKPYRFCVADEKKYVKENADLVLFENVRDVWVEVQDNRALMNRDEEDDEDYVPDYEYSFEFFVNLIIEGHPYINNINFRLNSERPELMFYNGSTDLEDLEELLTDPECKELYPVFGRKFLKYKGMIDAIKRMVYEKTM